MRATRHVSIPPLLAPLAVWLLPAVMLVVACAARAHAQTVQPLFGADTTPPAVSISPGSKATSTGTVTVTIGWCDNKNLASTSRSITLNGTSVTSSFSYTTGSEAGCGAYAVSTGTISLRVGQNTLSAQILDGSGNLGSSSVTYTFDNVAPTIAFTPASGGTYTQAGLSVTVTWGDNQSLNAGSRSLTLNGTTVTGNFSYSGSATSATSSGSITLSTGTNTLTAHICDAVGNCTSQSASYTYSPPTYAVAVTPDGTPVSADANSTSNTQVFVVKDIGNTGTTYTLTCSNPMGSCSKPGSVTVPNGGDSSLVTVTYQAGSPGTKATLSLTATSGSYSDAGSVSVTAYSHTVTVTPTSGADGTAVTATANQNNTASFTIKNTGTQQAAYTLTTSCPGTTGPCSLSGQSSPLTLNPGATASASVTYGAGADPSTGSAHLTATYTSNTAVKDDGWVNWTAAAPCESQSANASLSPCTHAMLTVLTNTTGIKDTLTLTSLSGAPLDYSIACNPTGPVTCTAAGDGVGTNDSNWSDQIIVTTNAGASDGNDTAHVVVTSAGAQVASSFAFEVLSPTSVVVSTSTGATHVDGGQPGSRSFTVQNAGHLAETFRLDTVCTGVVTQCVASATQVTLGAGASTTVSVSFVASGASGVGTVGLKATHVRSSAVTSTATASVIEDHAPASVALTPYNSDSYDPGHCVVACFTATASYTTPAYTSLDVARAVTLVYSSATADPRPVVQADVVDSSGTQADRISIRVHGTTDQTFANGSQEMFFTNAHALRRLAVEFDTTASLATGAYPYTLIVTSYWDADSTHQETDVPIRVLVDNEQQSPYGVGWSIAGLERDTLRGDSVLIRDGTGAVAFFRRQSCSASTCTYFSPPGDFSTLTSPVTIGTDGIAYTRRAPDGTTVSFNRVGLEASAQDRFGNKTTFGYDTSNRLSTITDPVGKITTLHYNTAGKLDYILDPMGRKTLITISSTTGDLLTIQDPAGGAPLQATYDSRHRLIKLTDRAGHYSNLGYDFAGELAADTLPTITVAGASARPVVQYGSLAAAELIKPTSGTGTSTNPAPGVDPNTLRAAVVDQRGDTTRYALNRFGQATRIEEPLGRVSTASYDDSARVASTVAPSSHRVNYTWSGPDLVQTTDVTTGQTVHMSYEQTYHQVDTVSGDATSVINTWSNGRLMSTNVGGAVTSFTYDSFGRLLTSTDPLGHVDSVAYVPSGLRNLASVSVAGRMTSFGTDTYGRVVTTTAPDTGVTTTVYDILNRVDTAIGPIADTTIYTYGDSLHLTKVRDAKHQVYQSTYNALGWVETSTDPTNHAETVAYDSAGNVVQATDRAGHVVKTFYDALNQIDSVIADGQTTTYSTDPLGHFVATSNVASTDTVFYDAAGRPDTAVTWRSTHRYVRVSTYDDLGLRTKLAVSGVWSGTISYGYDPVTHQLTSLTDLAGGVTTLGYNGDRLADTVRLPTTGGLTITTSYPSTHTTSDLSYSDAALNSALGASYSYSPTMQIAQRIPTAQPTDGSQTGREFQYDSLQRLASYDDYMITSGGWQNICDGAHFGDDNGNLCIVPDAGSKDTTSIHTFAYDKVGNRTDSGAVADTANRLLRFGGDTLIYDLDGNLKERKHLAGGFDQTYGWNSLGQLTSVTTNGATVTFTYDGFGQRVSKTTSTATTGYLYDGDNLLAELDGAGNPVAEYTYYPGIDQPNSVRRLSGGTWSTYYYALDLPNNVVGLINSSNALVDHYVYTPFGTLEDSSGTVPNSLRFGAREYDQETGLYYNRARYYDPTLGRFISEDPIGLTGGINPYIYAGDNPINAWDPTGLDCDTEANQGLGMPCVHITGKGGDGGVTVHIGGGGGEIGIGYSDPGPFGDPGAPPPPPGEDPPPSSESGPRNGTKHPVACTADVATNYVIDFVPGLDLANGGLAALGIGFHPWETLADGGMNPFRLEHGGIASTVAAGAAGEIGGEVAYWSAGGEAELERAAELAGRRSANAKALGRLAKISRFAKFARYAKTLTRGLSALNAVQGLIDCWRH